MVALSTWWIGNSGSQSSCESRRPLWDRNKTLIFQKVDRDTLVLPAKVGQLEIYFHHRAYFDRISGRAGCVPLCFWRYNGRERSS